VNTQPRARAPQAACTVLLVGNALLFPPRLGDKPVPEVFPERAMLLQVDQHPDLAALLVGDKLDSAHDSLSLTRRVRVSN